MGEGFLFYVYIMASDSGTLYIGMTGELTSRVLQHKSGKIEGFTKKYGCHKLVYYEEYEYVYDAIGREKQLKKWNRKKKEFLIATINSSWKDLAQDWGEDYDEIEPFDKF